VTWPRTDYSTVGPNQFDGDTRRVVVVGCVGSGKTSPAAALSTLLGAAHIERDALGREGSSEYRARVEEAIQQDRWVFDGTLYWVVDLVWTADDAARAAGVDLRAARLLGEMGPLG
jgi:hypothetical protein